MPLCGHGGYCTRVKDHAGVHTATPPPTTRRWDTTWDIDRAATLLLLDFPTPPWADLLDEDAA